MYRKRRLFAALGASTIAALGTVAFAAPASAAPALPTCVSVRHTTGSLTQTVYLTNSCAYGLGWFVDKEGPNSPCYHASAGASYTYKWSKADAYHGTYGC